MIRKIFSTEAVKEKPRVETVKDFKLRIAAIIGGNPEQVLAPRRTNPLLVRPKKQQKRRARR
jgi:hypothetical protein